MTDIKEKSRKELLSEYESYGGDKSDVAELSPEKIQKKIAEQRKLYDDHKLTEKKYMDMDIDEYTNLCQKHGIEPLKKHWWDLNQKIIYAELQEKLNTISDLISSKDEYQEQDLAKSVYYLEQNKGELDPDDIEAINLKIQHENVVRAKMGLEPKPLKLLDDDLEALLLISNWEIQGAVSEFLNQQTPAEKDRYRERFETLILLRNQEIAQTERRKEKIYKIEQQWERLETIPQKMIKHSGQLKWEVNKDYVEWCRNIQSFSQDLYYSIKSFGSDVPESIIEIQDIVNRKIKQHDL